MASVSIDTSEIRSLEADMRAVDSRLARWVRPVVSTGATKIKTAMRNDFRNSRYFHQVEPFVDFDWLDVSGAYAAEIGPRAEGPARIENIAYFGSSRAGGGTVRDPQEAANEELPNFQRELEKLAEELVFG